MPIKKQILGVNVDLGYTYDTVLSKIEQIILEKKPGSYICTTNPEFIIDAQKDLEFKSIINNADLSVPDGSGVLYADKYLSTIVNKPNNVLRFLRAFVLGLKIGISHKNTIGESITGVELTYRLAKLSSEKKYTVFLLGGKFKKNSKKDIATCASEQLNKLFPGVNIIGATSKFSRDPKDDEETCNYIKDTLRRNGLSHVDILLVAYNHGYQEKWIVRNAHKIPAIVSMGVGGTFNTITGDEKKAPSVFYELNLVWLYRLITQPSRYRRIVNAFPIFPLKVFINSIK